MKKNLFFKSKVAIILLFCFFLCGCSFENINNKISDLDVGINEELEKLESKDSFKKDPREDVEDGLKEEGMDISEDIKMKIDKWIEENNLNRYGDAIDTVYTGGTPLFNEATGEAIERYNYIIEKHPEVKKLFNLNNN